MVLILRFHIVTLTLLLLVAPGAAVAQLVRSITDRADGQASASYDQFLAAASENAATLVAAIIARLDKSAR